MYSPFRVTEMGLLVVQQRRMIHPMTIVEQRWDNPNFQTPLQKREEWETHSKNRLLMANIGKNPWPWQWRDILKLILMLFSGRNSFSHYSWLSLARLSHRLFFLIHYPPGHTSELGLRACLSWEQHNFQSLLLVCAIWGAQVFFLQS